MDTSLKPETSNQDRPQSPLASKVTVASRGLTRGTILLFALLLLTDVSALVFEKWASTHAVGAGLGFYGSLVEQPGMWIGIGLGPVQLLIWRKILSKVDLSVAFPVSSFSFPTTVLASQLILGEHVSPRVWLATAIITIGVMLIGQEKQSEKRAD